MSNNYGIKINDEVLGGIDCTIWCSRDGRFVVTANATGNPFDEEVVVARANMYDDVIAGARQKISRSKVRVRVEFFTPEGRPGVATGIHAGSSRVVARIDGGASEQLGGYSSRTYLRGDTPPEKLDELRQLRQDIAAREARLRAITREFGMDLHSVVDVAVQLRISDDD